MSQDDGTLEIHVPRSYTPDRPAVYYTHDSYQMSIRDHPRAKLLPKATDEPSIQSGPEDFREFAARTDAPSTTTDFVHSDIPQLSLHITSFTDATLVALSWPHTLMDVMGQRALLQSWSLVLAGRISEVPALLGTQEDVVRAMAEAPSDVVEEFKLGSSQLSGLSMLRFGIRFAWDLLWSRPVETRTICLPVDSIAKLREQVSAEIAIHNRKDTSSFVSEGDILSAWAIRAIASSSPQPRPVTALHALNMRFRIRWLAEAPGVYVQNLATAGFTFLSHSVASGDLGTIALMNREHLQEQSTESQVLAFLRQLLQQSSSDPAIICGDTDAILVPFTNWTKADFAKCADFSPAIVQRQKAREQSLAPPGHITFHHAQSLRPNASARNVFVIMGKDHNGNYWITATLHPPTWDFIESSLEDM